MRNFRRVFLLLAILLICLPAYPVSVQAADSVTEPVADPATKPVTKPDADALKTQPTSDRTASNGRVAVVSDLEASASTLLKLFVLATLLESAMAIVFNWRPFLILFDGRGMKTPCMLFMALLVVCWFNVNVVQTLAAQYKFPAIASEDLWFANLLTAMVIAGGSAGVNKLLVTLGYRSVLTVENLKPRPAPTQAWISVTWLKDAANPEVSAVKVEIMAAGGFNVVGQLNCPSNSNPLRYLFFRDFGRFPHSGGWDVAVGVPLSVRLVDVGNPGKCSEVWSGTLQAGAMVDIELRL